MKKLFIVSVVAMVGLAGFLGTRRHAPLPVEPLEPARPNVIGGLALMGLETREFDIEEFDRKFLNALNEKPLANMASEDHNAIVFGVLWLPTFDNPIAVRVVKSDQGALVRAVRLSGKGGYEPGTIVLTKTTSLTNEQWASIAAKVENADFWKLGAYEGEPLSTGVEDGHRLIVEGVKEGKYHRVARFNPEKGDFTDLCQEMIFASGIDARKLWLEYCD